MKNTTFSRNTTVYNFWLSLYFHTKITHVLFIWTSFWQQFSLEAALSQRNALCEEKKDTLFGSFDQFFLSFKVNVVILRYTKPVKSVFLCSDYSSSMNLWLCIFHFSFHSFLIEIQRKNFITTVYLFISRNLSYTAYIT